MSFLVKLGGWIKKGVTKTWAAIKSLPGWAVAVLLFLAALCWWLINLVLKNKRLAELEKLRGALETNRAKKLAKVDVEEHEEIARVNKRFNDSLLNLEREKAELEAAADAGPAAVALKWKEHLAGNKDE